jgi:phosphoglycerate dehydrogenase-like enzyme
VLEEVFGSPSFQGRTVLLQGVGAVGGRLAELVKQAGARVIVCDIDERSRERAFILDYEHYAITRTDVIPVIAYDDLDFRLEPLIRRRLQVEKRQV